MKSERLCVQFTDTRYLKPEEMCPVFKHYTKVSKFRFQTPFEKNVSENPKLKFLLDFRQCLKSNYLETEHLLGV